MRLLNPHARRAKAIFAGKALFLNAKTANYYKTTSMVNFISIKTLNMARITAEEVQIVSKFKQRWHVISLVIGLDKDDNPAFQAKYGRTDMACYQYDATQSINQLMSDAVHERDRTIRVVKNTAWLATPYKLNITDAKLADLLTKFGAW